VNRHTKDVLTVIAGTLLLLVIVGFFAFWVFMEALIAYIMLTTGQELLGCFMVGVVVSNLIFGTWSFAKAFR